jgi:cyclopropane fatty-acyl-phospholipid synthase-like methyltransferase
MHAFDLTPSMIQRFRQTLAAQDIEGVEIAEANVLALDALPRGWANYDLIVSASMLEYVARDQLADALKGLRELLTAEGRLILFITRRNWITQPLIGQWWRSNLYGADELREAFKLAGYSQVYFRRFPLIASHLTIWGHVIEACK